MRDWSHTSSIARRLLWWRRSLHRSPDVRSRRGDPFFVRQTFALAEAIPSSFARRSRSPRRSLLRSPDDRARGGDPFFVRRLRGALAKACNEESAVRAEGLRV